MGYGCAVLFVFAVAWDWLVVWVLLLGVALFALVVELLTLFCLLCLNGYLCL